MADKPTGKSRQQRETTAEEFATTGGSAQYASGDYSYTVELVGSVQRELGQLTEAIKSLREQSKENNQKIDQLRMDMHAAKTLWKVIVWQVGIVGAILGILLTAYARTIFGLGVSHP